MRKLLYFAMMAMTILACTNPTKPDGVFLVNHIGYQNAAYKSAVLQLKSESSPVNFFIVDAQGNEVFEGQFEKGGAIDKWHTGAAYKALFTEFTKEGTYTLKAIVKGGSISSEPFQIKAEPIAVELMPLLIKAFHLQRCISPYNDADKNMSFYGERTDKVDVSGGWYDASGEKGKYLSHLSFSNYMTPQQLPMMVWNMLEAAEVIRNSANELSNQLIQDLTAEAAYGADYLVRIQDEAGYFYATVFAGWTKDPQQRQICAYEGQDGKRNERYQAAFREGGGLAIAALARCYAQNISGEFGVDDYLKAAVTGYSHLLANNLNYCDDGTENIIDDYCALLAATELYKATNGDNYLSDAQVRAGRLSERLMKGGGVHNWLRADADGKRPFFHGAEAGLPVIAMAHYLTIEKDDKKIAEASNFIKQALSFEVWVTNEVNNPFGYARQYVKATNEEQPRTAFFLPHQNETGYWWQGENARLASLATAVFKAQNVLDADLKLETQQFGWDQINWVLGINPFNVCMLHGAGRNNPDYQEDGKSMNYLGGICNGITGGFDDEQDIAFRPLPYDDDPSQRWRWSEQWLQHGGWMIPAMAYSLELK